MSLRIGDGCASCWVVFVFIPPQVPGLVDGRMGWCGVTGNALMGVLKHLTHACLRLVASRQNP
ncbi:hypothetical protein [Acidovorax radicis]|jgi:hypothetical protein|uniref:hypothetical protein n=1 Tax=Acidovorax radicis TaxID=758826 RepID=UPI001CF9D332|nr:hypothetical protein [Acidovorax radicis]UCV00732.1 hypothetical protein KI609_08270 [Acidovorax radicis]